MTTLWLALLAAFAGAAFGKGDALAPELKRMEGLGFKPEKTLSQKIGPDKVAVLLFRNPERSWDKLNIYAELKGKFFMIYTHPGSNERLDLDPAASAGFSDFLKDGSRALAYTAVIPGLNKKVLHIVRYRKFQARQVAEFAEGRLQDVDGDGTLEIVSKPLPLGRFFTVECANFDAMAKTAYRTDIHTWRQGKYHDVSTKFPAFYESQIARTEERLSLLQKEKHAAEYLGASISVYYDFLAMGQRQRGWERFSELIKPPPYPIPGLHACQKKVKDELRRLFSIPQDWP